MSSMMDNLHLSQRVGPSDYGCDPYQVVVSTPNGELVHEYCLYSSAYGGPVRPDPVTGLRAEPTGGGRATVKWEWSENSFDLASPGAYFARDVIVEEGRLAWDGKVRKRPRTKPVAPTPKVELSRELHAKDVTVKSEWRQNGCDDEWEIHVSHAPTGSRLVCAVHPTTFLCFGAMLARCPSDQPLPARTGVVTPRRVDVGLEAPAPGDPPGRHFGQLVSELITAN